MIKSDGRGHKLTWDDVEKIREEKAQGKSAPAIAEEHGISRRMVYDIVNHVSWPGSRPSPLKGRKTGRAPANKMVETPGSWEEKKRKAMGTTRTKRYTIDQYNQAYEAYCEVQSPSYVAKKSGINEHTAAKVIKDGDPSRNLRPLRDRFHAVMDQSQRQQDYTLAVCRDEYQKIARALLAKTAKRIQALKPDEIKPFLLPRLLKDLQAVTERALGVADATVKVESENRFERWSIEELMSFVETGTVPEHDLMAQGAKKK